MNNPISIAESREEENGKMENVRLKINQVILAYQGNSAQPVSETVNGKEKCSRAAGHS